MLTSFSTALSALNADTTAMDVVGNNLANLNTSGFKASTVSFHDLVTQSIGAGLGATQVGFGVGTPITLRHFSQGAIQTSSGPLDARVSRPVDCSVLSAVLLSQPRPTMHDRILLSVALTPTNTPTAPKAPKAAAIAGSGFAITRHSS